MGGNGTEGRNTETLHPMTSSHRMNKKNQDLCRMTSDKKSAALLAEIFVKKGLKHIVISPGSRNAPIILSFAQNPAIEVLSLIDERSAAFFALGIAQQTRRTVAIACTSGTAALNYAPAIAEAYYQKIPLLVLTADRPTEFIDQGDGQTIRQKNVYKNFIKASYELQEKISNENEFTAAQKLFNKAINQTVAPDFGPVHINLPFSEPIYNQVKSHNWLVKTIYPYFRNRFLNTAELEPFARSWNRFSKKVLIAGMMEPGLALASTLKKLANDQSVVLLSETTSNLDNCCDSSCIDKVIHTILPEEANDFKPELLVTFGGPVVSKMVKEFFRRNRPIEHWHIDPVDFGMNSYQCLTSGIQAEPLIFFNQLLIKIEQKESFFKQLWKSRINRSEEKHREYLKNLDYSDLKVFETLLKSIPENSDLHLGNSTPVRYAQLFKPVKHFNYFSNRGVSGIDGTVSTAAGACFATQKPTTLITGDLGFLYDSNALLNPYLNKNLRIIIINNSGGGIFRFIKGPDSTEQLEKFFEAKHDWNSEYIAKNFNVPYYHAYNLREVKEVLPIFYEMQPDNRPAILEIFTPNEKNGQILKSYFKFLKD